MITKTWQQRHRSEIGDINVETETVELSSWDSERPDQETGKM